MLIPGAVMVQERRDEGRIEERRAAARRRMSRC